MQAAAEASRTKDSEGGVNGNWESFSVPSRTFETSRELEPGLSGKPPVTAVVRHLPVESRR